LSAENIKLQNILNRKIDACRELRQNLAQVIDHQSGTAWGYEQMEEICGHFDTLKSLDGEWQFIEANLKQPINDKKITTLATIYRKELLGIRELLTTYETSMIGARSLVEYEIRQVTTAKKVRGYHPAGRAGCLTPIQVC
jgi:hypothetical protein